MLRISILFLLFVSLFSYSVAGKIKRSSRKEPPRTQEAYVIVKDQGSAGKLQGVCLLFHIFIQPQGAEPWSEDLINEVMQKNNEASQWIVDKAPFKLAFIHEKLDVDTNWPSVDRMLFWKSDTNKQASLWRRALYRVYHEHRELIRRYIVQAKAQNFAMLVHINRWGKSFAHRSNYLSNVSSEFDLEFALYFLHDIDRKRSLGSAKYAHEIFHLFGADDLYLIRGAKKYFPRDIMGARNPNLDNVLISPLTAYAVGWQEEMPLIQAFQVLEHKRVKN